MCFIIQIKKASKAVSRFFHESPSERFSSFSWRRARRVFGGDCGCAFEAWRLLRRLFRLADGGADDIFNMEDDMRKFVLSGGECKSVTVLEDFLEFCVHGYERKNRIFSPFDKDDIAFDAFSWEDGRVNEWIKAECGGDNDEGRENFEKRIKDNILQRIAAALSEAENFFILIDEITEKNAFRECFRVIAENTRLERAT